jgi:Fe2+ or Zn2+ uptake regulation protein
VIIWGFRTTAQQLAILVARCALQGHTAAHAVVRRRTKFTLFFIPLFQVSSKHVLVCSLCGNATPMAKENVPAALAEAQRQEVERAGQQFAEFQAPVAEPGVN